MKKWIKKTILTIIIFAIIYAVYFIFIKQVVSDDGKAISDCSLYQVLATNKHCNFWETNFLLIALDEDITKTEYDNVKIAINKYGKIRNFDKELRTIEFKVNSKYELDNLISKIKALSGVRSVLKNEFYTIPTVPVVPE